MSFRRTTPPAAVVHGTIAAFLCVLVGAGLWLPANFWDSEAQAVALQQTAPAAPAEARLQRSPADPEDLQQALAVSRVFQDVARAIGPSVVNITTLDEVQRMPAQPRSPFDSDPFEDFFERFFGPRMQPRQFQQPQPAPQQEPELRRQGQASGLIVSEDGYIVTNFHVVGNADTIHVRLSNGQEYDATIVGTDPETDLAVLRIESEATLTPASFGDSQELNPGEWIIAVGSALGLENTVTTGVVSATGRQVGIIRDQMTGFVGFEDFIQTDAAINPGNSGGPLLNLYGEVVGINTAIATRTGGYMGIGFAIPSNMVRPVVEAIIEDGEVRRGWLGVVMGDLTPELAEDFNFDSTDGVVLAEVTPGSPAEEAGLRHSDIIVSIDGRRMRSSNELRNTVAMQPPGTIIRVEVFREGETMTHTVTLGTRPTQEELAQQQRQRMPPTQRLGLNVRDLSPQMARQLGLPEGGVVVTDVERGSIAHRAGIAPNDLILSVGRRDVTSVQEYNEALAEHDLAEGVRLRVRSGNVTRIFILRSRD